MNKRKAKKNKKFLYEKSNCKYPSLVKGWSEIRWMKQLGLYKS